MARLVFKIVLVSCVAVILLYISRFWPVELWARRGSMLSDLGLRPQGGMLQVWLRGSGFASFELVIWALISFITLSAVEKIANLGTPAE